LEADLIAGEAMRMFRVALEEREADIVTTGLAAGAAMAAIGGNMDEIRSSARKASSLRGATEKQAEVIAVHAVRCMVRVPLAEREQGVKQALDNDDPIPGNEKEKMSAVGLAAHNAHKKIARLSLMSIDERAGTLATMSALERKDILEAMGLESKTDSSKSVALPPWASTLMAITASEDPSAFEDDLSLELLKEEGMEPIEQVSGTELFVRSCGGRLDQTGAQTKWATLCGLYSRFFDQESL